MRTTFIFIFYFFFFYSIDAQNKGNVVYRIVTEKLESQENQFLAKEKFNNMMNSMSRIRDSLFFNLDFNGSEALFYLNKSKNVGMSNEKGYNSIVRSLNSVFYRNNDTAEIIEQITNDRLYLITSSTKDFKWEITTERKKINQYLCYKAITVIKSKSITKGDFSKKIEAWFSPEIAVNFGPKNFGGLPGLIMELKDDMFTYYIESLTLDSRAHIEVTKPTKGRVVTRNKYFDLKPTITKENFKEYIGG
jgi:GLPGLI family protein